MSSRDCKLSYVCSKFIVTKTKTPLTEAVKRAYFQISITNLDENCVLVVVCGKRRNLCGPPNKKVIKE